MGLKVFLTFCLFWGLTLQQNTANVRKISLSEAVQQMEDRLRMTAESMVKRVLPSLLRTSGDIDLSDECQTAILQVIMGVKNLKPWAINMLDAIGKPPSGILEGAAIALGSYDQCLDIINANERSSETIFVGQYCSVEMHPFEPGTVVQDKYLETTPNFTRKESSGLFADPNMLFKSKLRMGLCIPSSCSTDDLQMIIEQVSKLLNVYLKVVRCEKKTPLTLESSEFTSLGIFACVIFIVALCTIIDLCKRKKPMVIQDTTVMGSVIQTLSFVSNTERFLSYHSNDPDLSALAGIRFLSLLWNILGNCYFLGYVLEFAQYSRRTSISKFEEQFTYGAVSNFFVSYETPFFVSGVIGTYACLKRVRTMSKIRTVFRNLAEDFLRMTIITIATTLISLGFVQANNGPLWADVITPLNENCKNNWWRNFIHIANFFPAKECCLIHNWILSSHIHIQIACLAVILPLLFARKLGVLLNFIYMVGSMAVIMVITLVYNLPPALDGVTRDYGEEIDDFVGYIVIRPYTHLGAYCIGIFVAIIILEYKEIKLNKFIMAAGWILAGGCCIGSVYALIDFRKGYDVGAAVGAIYAGLHRCVFALAIGWVTFVCARTQKGLIKRILSWKVFAVVDQLTIIMFVVHPMLIISQMAATRERVLYDHDIHINNFFAISCRTLIISFVLHVLVEQPLLTFNKWLWSRDPTTDKDSVSSRKVPPPISARGISLKNILILEPHDGPVAGK